MNDIKNAIMSKYNDNDIVHIFSIILRAWYEKKQMDLIKKNQDFELKQMEKFIIEYDTESFKLILDNKEFKMTKEALDSFVEYIYDYFNKKYPIDYNYKLIDPVYFSLFFYDLLDKIVNIKYDTINIRDIRLLRYNSAPVKMDESERYKLLLDNNYKMYSPFKSNLIINTPEDRVKEALKSIKENGYGYNGKYAIFYNNEPYIRDGQHRVAAVKYLNGDIDIKIVRIYLKDNYFYE